MKTTIICHAHNMRKIRNHFIVMKEINMLHYKKLADILLQNTHNFFLSVFLI